MAKMILIGYWVNKGSHSFNDTKMYADPGKLQDTFFWKSRQKHQVIQYLQTGPKINHYRGFSSCRICGKPLGSCEITDGKYVWPAKMEHYIEEHDLKIPDEFYNHIESNSFKVPDFDLSGTYWHLDERFWIEWSSRYLTDYTEPKKDIDLRNRAVANGTSVLEQGVIERLGTEIQDAVDDEILGRIEKGDIDIG